MKKHLTYHKVKNNMTNLHFENLEEFTTLFREKNKEVSDAIRIGVEKAKMNRKKTAAVSYTHLRAHETDSYLVCRLLLEKSSLLFCY